MEQGAGLTPGLIARVELLVGDADTAQALGSGDVPVLGTPRVLALAEAATVAATSSHLPAGFTSVGVHVQLDHRSPTPVGRLVVAEALLTRSDGRRLTFDVTVRDEDLVIADGQVERIVVDRHRFVEKATGGA
ncbi:putative thioesterase [Allocatelliglobosispora scoriae]|uniref:Putative thioesterase n=1 Tax=Allocatelliglobosispora scoriae TaxID=643052 RepID=A0A841C046_9ACTN|nr:hotdog domain-containing protein [Allocatelliglobosispora scoriae]MBB5873118.1 putative thioesterase [Allocatelliglobosispora scoriae]